MWQLQADQHRLTVQHGVQPAEADLVDGGGICTAPQQAVFQTC